MTAIATPVDFGDVCVNDDLAWFAEHDLAPPADLEALADPAYRDLLVVENPAASSPGLAFLLATIARYGDDGWADYWSRLTANGVEVVDGWTEAYYDRFSGAGDGDRPLVVSYGTSPPAEVLFADPPIDAPTTGVIADTCFRQVEYAGVLRGTDAPDAAHRLVDFLLTPAFQSEIALNLFVYPANDTVSLPAAFTDFAVVPDHPATLDPATHRRPPPVVDRDLDRRRAALSERQPPAAVAGACRRSGAGRPAGGVLRLAVRRRWSPAA